MMTIQDLILITESWTPQSRPLRFFVSGRHTSCGDGVCNILSKTEDPFFEFSVQIGKTISPSLDPSFILATWVLKRCLEHQLKGPSPFLSHFFSILERRSLRNPSTFSSLHPFLLSPPPLSSRREMHQEAYSGWTRGGEAHQKIGLKSEVNTSPTWKLKKGSLIDIDLEFFFQSLRFCWREGVSKQLSIRGAPQRGIRWEHGGLSWRMETEATKKDPALKKLKFSLSACFVFAHFS